MTRDRQDRYLLVKEATAARPMDAVYGGRGPITVGRYFRAEGVAAPVLLATYRLPPGTSEGLHTHGPGDRECGEFLEFYFVISGVGAMTLGEEVIAVTDGDYVYVPAGTPRGLANTSTDQDLRVHIVAIPPLPSR